MASVKVVGKDNDGAEVTVFVKKPGAKENTQAKIYANKLASELLVPDETGKVNVLLRSQTPDKLKQLGVWSDTDDTELKNISLEIFRKERLLACGGKGGVTKSQARANALDIKKLRAKQGELLSKSRELDGLTLESQTEQASFDSLFTQCVLNESGEQLFKSVSEYKEATQHPYLRDAAVALVKIIFGSDDDEFKKLPEIAFLIKYGFADQKGRLIDASGHLIDEETGKWINEDGYFVDENNNPVDRDGNRLTKDGEILEEFVEFTE